MISLFHTYLINPIYNLLIYLIGIVPGADAGIAVILVTVAVKVLILPLSLSAVRTQRAMKVIEPELSEIRKRYKDDREKQARETFALYKKYNVKPFASFFMLLIQIPILLALYLVFSGEKLPTVDLSILYSFVPIPENISVMFLGIFLITGKSLILALIAGATQFLQAYFAIPTPPKVKNATMQEDFGRAMALQARFVIPIIIMAVAYETSVAIALYFITSNVVMLFQEFLVRKNPRPLVARETEEKA